MFVPSDAHLRALDNETGEELWNVSKEDLGRSSALLVRHVSVEDGLVVMTAGGFNAGMYAIYAENGTEAWSDTDFDGGHLAISNGTVYVERSESSDVYIHAYDLQSGDELWSVDHDAAEASGGLAVSRDIIYATAKVGYSEERDYAVYALNASNEGEERWRFEVEGPITDAPTVVNGTVFFGSGDSEYDPKFYALNESDGHVEWIRDLNTQAHGAAVADGTVYVSVGNTLRALDEDSGEEDWNYALMGSRDHGAIGDPINVVPPAVADGIVYVGNDEGHVVAVNGSTGDSQWTYRVEGEAQQPTITDGRVYIHAPDERDSDDVVRVYALEEPPFAFSNLDPSATTVAPGEELLVNVTVENVDDGERTYDLSLMGERVLPGDWRPVAKGNGTLASGATTTVTFATRIDTTGSWNLSIKRNLERTASIGPVTIEVVHSQPDDDWPMAGFDTGWTDSNPNASAPARHLQERWTAARADGSEFDDLSEPVVQGSTAYLLHVTEAGSSDYYHLAAHDLESGDVEWEYNLTSDHRVPRGSPTAVDGTVYVFTKSFTGYGDGTPDPDVGTIYAFDAAGGDVTWTTNTSLNSTNSRFNYDYAPIVANDRVYIGAANNHPDGLNASLIALHADDGSENWTYRVADENEDERFLPVAVSGDNVIAMLSDEDGAGSFVESLVAIDARNGSLQWQNESFDLATDEQIVADDERVYAINRTTDGEGNSVEELYALSVADGSEAWRFRPPNVSTTSNSYDEWILFKPVVSDDAVYVVQRDTESGNAYQRLNRINASTGDLEWRVSFYLRSGVTVADGLVYAAGPNSGTHLYDAATGDYLGEHGAGLGNSGAVRTIANDTMFAWDEGEGGGLRAFVEGGVFEYTDLSVSSNRVETGENVTITATVTNTGALTRSYLVNLRTSPDVTWLDRERRGTLAPGQSETLTWEDSFDERGDYVAVLGPSDDESMDSHVYDRTDSVTINVGDDRDGETITLDGPRSIDVTDDSWPTADLDAGNTGNHSETAAPTDVGSDVDDVVVDNIRWRSAPSVVNDTIYFGGYDGSDERVYAYNVTDGSLEWSYRTYRGSGEVTSAPTYADGHLYVPIDDGRIYVLNATTGERLWVHNVAESFDSVNGVTVVDGVAYVAISYGTSPTVGRIDALDATTRERLWTFETTETGWDPMPVTPAVENGTVYLSNDNGKSYALNASSGAEEWNRSISGPSGAVHSPVVEDGVAYVDNGTALFALDAADGTTLWNTSATVDGDSGSSPAIANDTLYFVDSGSVRAVNASDGSTRWTELICADVPTSPAVAGDVVFITTGGGTVHAFDGTSGELVWRFDAGTEIDHSPAVVDGVLYTTSLEESVAYRLYALTGGTTNETIEYIQFSNLVVSATDVTVGEEITVEANVENVGEASCSYDASLFIDDDEVDNTTDSVPDGSTETVSFAHTFDSTGTYNVTIENLTSVEVNVTGAEPEVDVSPTSYEFRDVEADNTGDWTSTQFTITNVGQADLDWVGSDLSGPDEGSFDVTSGESGGVLGPSEQQTITVWFAPFDPGTKTATLNVYTNDTENSTVEVSLSGTAVADPPEVQVTPTTLDFGDVTNGSSAVRNVTVENVGGSALSFDGVTLGSSDYDSFEVLDGDITTSLDPGETHNVTVAFAPTSENADTTTLTVNTDDPDDGSVDVSLSGTGVAPEPGRAKVEPTSIDFGDVVNGTSVSRNVTVENVGDVNLEFKNAAIGGSDFGSFSLDGDGTPATLTPGGTRNVTVTFAPTSATPDTATLTIETNDPNASTVDVTLSGNGVLEPAPDIDVSPMGYFYESVPVDGADSSTFLVNNTGEATLNVTNVTVTGANASEFTPLSASFTIAPGGRFDLLANFEPTTLGSKSALLEITSNDTDEPTVLVELGGQAVDTTAPTVRIVTVAGSNESGSTVRANGTVDVEVNATDEHSQIDEVIVALNSTGANFAAYANATYDVPSGNWTASFGSVDVPDDGAYAVEAVALDSASNVNWTTSTQTVVVDRTTPQLGASLIRVDETTAAANLTASEPLRSGSVDVTVMLPDGNETTVQMDGTGQTWNGTFSIGENGQYEIDATGIDFAGNHGYDNATATFQALNTTDRTVTVVLEPSGTFVRFNTQDDVENTFVVLTDSRTPLAPLGNDRAGLNFLRAQLGAKLEANMTNATIGVPVDASRVPRGAGKGDVDLSYFNETNKEWEDLSTEIMAVTIDGSTDEYWVTEVEHFSTYGATVTDTKAPMLDSTSPSSTLPAGTTYTEVQFEYSDDISGVDASSVVFEFDGHTVSGSDLSVTKAYASYNATGLSAGTYPASVKVSDVVGNPATFTTSITVDSSSSAGGSSSSPPGSSDGDEPTTTEATSTPTATQTTLTPSDTSTSMGTADPPATPMSGATSPATPTPLTTSTPGGQPGFSLVVTALALLGALLVAGRRR